MEGGIWESVVPGTGLGNELPTVSRRLAARSTYFELLSRAGEARFVRASIDALRFANALRGGTSFSIRNVAVVVGTEDEEAVLLVSKREISFTSVKQHDAQGKEGLE